MNEDEDFMDDLRIPSPKGRRKLYDVQYESLSVQAVGEALQKDADHIMGIFGVDVSTLEDFQPVVAYPQT